MGYYTYSVNHHRHIFIIGRRVHEYFLSVPSTCDCAWGTAPAHLIDQCTSIGGRSSRGLFKSDQVTNLVKGVLLDKWKNGWMDPSSIYPEGWSFFIGLRAIPLLLKGKGLLTHVQQYGYIGCVGRTVDVLALPLDACQCRSVVAGLPTFVGYKDLGNLRWFSVEIYGYDFIYYVGLVVATLDGGCPFPEMP